MRNILLFLILLLFACPCAAESDWNTAPVITEAYECGKDELYLEWSGAAPLYRIYLDTKEAATVLGHACTIQVKDDKRHMVTVSPLTESENQGLLAFDANLPIIGAFGINLSSGKLDFNAEKTPLGKAGLSIDVSALGLDMKKLEQGNPSKPLAFTSQRSDLASQVISDLSVSLDDQGRACLTFTDYKNAEEYVVYIHKDKNVSPVVYSTRDADGSAWISRNVTTVTLTLDPGYLMQNDGMVPALGNTYSFSIELRKRVTSLVTGEKIEGEYYTSGRSREVKATLKALWKTAPVIISASQTSEGQVLLEWEHHDHGTGCDYNIYQVEKALGVRTGEKLVETSGDHSCLVSDLRNGSYTFVVSALYGSEEGDRSGEATVEVKNDWEAAPEIFCQAGSETELSISWDPSPDIDAYHITVYLGNEKSLLKYANMDWTKADEAYLDVSGGPMEFVYPVPDGSPRLKFEVYGVRYTEDGSEQNSAVGTVTYPK